MQKVLSADRINSYQSSTSFFEPMKNIGGSKFSWLETSFGMLQPIYDTEFLLSNRNWGTTVVYEWLILFFNWTHRISGGQPRKVCEKEKSSFPVHDSVITASDREYFHRGKIMELVRKWKDFYRRDDTAYSVNKMTPSPSFWLSPCPSLMRPTVNAK